jgi:hypothetical protein
MFAGAAASHAFESPRGETPAALGMLSIEAIAAPGRCPRTTTPDRVDGHPERGAEGAVE